MSAAISSPGMLDVSLAEPIVRTAQGNLDVLTDLEIRIARRADQLSAAHPSYPGSNLYCWLRAEHEILANADFLHRPLEVPQAYAAA